MSDLTFSEHGEDILIHRLMLWKENGFYMDCGAYHPRKMSLTARLRLFGWKGINIDADPRVIALFEKQTPECINLNIAISAKEGSALLRTYDDPVLNTISKKQMTHLDAIEKETGLFTKILSEKKVQTRTIRSIVDKNKINNIDFLNLDIEGVELEAIQSFPWEKIQPTVICCEIHRLNLQSCDSDPVVSALYDIGYILQSYVFHTAIFVKADFDTEDCHKVSFKTL